VALALAPEQAVLGDVNPEIVNFYTTLRDHEQDLLDGFNAHIARSTKEYYYEIRDHVPGDTVARAIRFLYLNKTCFNGLYRENAKGIFNVPYGDDHQPAGIDEVNFRAVGRWLRACDIMLLNSPFQVTLAGVQPGDVVYLDPPYYPVNPASFVKYHASVDSDPDAVLKGVADRVRELRDMGVTCVVSNSNTPAVRAAFEGFTIEGLEHAHTIGAAGASRAKKVNELLIHTGREMTLLDWFPDWDQP
jgi:DNA adenine methylase